LIRLPDDPYIQILDHDIREYRSCSFHWDCENCTKNLCINLVGVTERVPLEVPAQEHDEHYMKTKKERFGHKLRL